MEIQRYGCTVAAISHRYGGGLRGSSPKRATQTSPPRTLAGDLTIPAAQRRGKGKKGGEEGGIPFTGDAAADVLPMSSRILTSSFISLSSESAEGVHLNRPSSP